MVEKKKEFATATEKTKAYNDHIQKNKLDKLFPREKALSDLKRIGLITMVGSVLMSLFVAWHKKATNDEEMFYIEQKYHLSSLYEGMTIEEVQNNQKGMQTNDFAIVLASCALLAILYDLANRKTYKDSKKAVDLMLQLKNEITRFDIDVSLLKKLTAKVPEVFAHMASSSRVYFDLLLSGDFPLDENAEPLKLATIVMAEHLRTHPKDYELLVSVFDEKSLPEEIIERYGSDKKKSR